MDFFHNFFNEPTALKLSAAKYFSFGNNFFLLLLLLTPVFNILLNALVFENFGSEYLRTRLVFLRINLVAALPAHFRNFVLSTSTKVIECTTQEYRPLSNSWAI